MQRLHEKPVKSIIYCYYFHIYRKDDESYISALLFTDVFACKTAKIIVPNCVCVCK